MLNPMQHVSLITDKKKFAEQGTLQTLIFWFHAKMKFAFLKLSYNLPDIHIEDFFDIRPNETGRG
jgi:hypothetical protein